MRAGAFSDVSSVSGLCGIQDRPGTKGWSGTRAGVQSLNWRESMWSVEERTHGKKNVTNSGTREPGQPMNVLLRVLGGKRVIKVTLVLNMRNSFSPHYQEVKSCHVRNYYTSLKQTN